MMSKSKLLVAEDDPEMELHGTVVFQPVEENNSARGDVCGDVFPCIGATSVFLETKSSYVS